MAIKASLGKLPLNLPIDRLIEQALGDPTYAIFPLKLQHVSRVATLPFHHRDPFDRILIAEALVEDLSVVSNDGEFDAYGVKRIW